MIKEKEILLLSGGICLEGPGLTKRTGLFFPWKTLILDLS